MTKNMKLIPINISGTDPAGVIFKDCEQVPNSQVIYIDPDSVTGISAEHGIVTLHQRGGGGICIHNEKLCLMQLAALINEHRRMNDRKAE